jgi:hypothetical protein
MIHERSGGVGFIAYSKHGVLHEEAELAAFTEAVRSKGVNQYLMEAFYDSRSGCCHFTLVKPELISVEAMETIRRCALSTLAQFELEGKVHHGIPMQIAGEGIASHQLKDSVSAFDPRLASLRAAAEPRVELLAAITVFERTRTARAICEAVLTKASPEVVGQLVIALGQEVHASKTIARTN